MTPEALAARLTERGLDAAEAERKRELLQSVTRAFPSFSNGSPAYAWWIPGRLEVFGKHTDYCGGHSLVGAVPRGFVLVARPRTDDIVRVLDARRAELLEFAAPAEPVIDVERPELEAGAATGWRRYAHVVVRRLRRNFPGASIGADIVFASDLPSASGMSSSSALVVGFGNALAEVAGLRARPEWRENVQSAVTAAGYYACFENGLSFGSLSGGGGVGTHGGSEDHVAIVCGGAHQLSAWQFIPIRHIGTAMLPEAWTFVIAWSGVAARKLGPAREKYNSLARRAQALLDVWNRAEPPQPSLFAALTSAPSAPERMLALVRQQGEATADLEARLDHFVREDRRVLDALEAVRGADRPRLGELSDASQTDAESLLGNQVPETIALVRAARDLGAFAASSFGAGFGGSVWALVDREEGEEFAESWLADYHTHFPSRTTATTFVARPGPPLTRLV